MRGVTTSKYTTFDSKKISTHTPHARRDLGIETFLRVFIISTHTPHARRDLASFFYFLQIKISTHTPHARRDPAR